MRKRRWFGNCDLSSHPKQEVKQQMSKKIKLETNQGVEIIPKREVQEEIIITQQKRNPKQGKRGNSLANYAKKLHIQIYLGAKNSRSIYQETQKTPRVFPKKYAKTV